MQNGKEFVCPNVGYYPDNSDVKCEKYFYCAKLKGTLKPYVYSCPPDIKWDPSIRRCSTTYFCPYTTLAPTTITTTTEDITTIAPSFICKEQGRFLNYNAKNCSGYFYCGKKCNDGGFVLKHYDCPPPSIFDVSISMCNTFDTKCSLI